MRTLAVGEHNLRDEHGVPSFFGDVLLFTEAVPRRIRARRRKLLSRALARSRARLAGTRIVSHRRDRSLAAAFPRDLLQLTSKTYHRAHAGIAKVTPHRGTLVLRCRTRDTDRKVAIVVEHRINAAFPPYKRGEPLLRMRLWEEHTTLTLRLIDELEAEGYFVIAGGDLNVPREVLGYQDRLREISTSLDRLACSDDGRWSAFERLSPNGSDHHRIRATLTLPKEF